MSSLVNKVKEALHSDKHTEQPEGTHGPHSGRVANAADPRVDSDRDHRAAPGGTTGAYSGTTGTTGTTGGLGNTGNTGTFGSSTGNTGTLGSSGTTGTGTYSSTTGSRGLGTDGPATKTDGPHNSNVMNKMDPRVDSDRDNSRNMGANPQGTSGTGAYNVGSTGTTGGYSSGTTGTSGTTGAFSSGTTGSSGLGRTTGSSGVPEGTFGPHSSRAANAADPRVDSDRDNTRDFGTRSGATGAGGLSQGGLSQGTHGTSELHSHGTHGTSELHSSSGAREGTFGPHSSRMANAADPRVDSDRDNSRNFGASTGTTGAYGSGTTGTTGAYGSGTGTTGTSSVGGAGGLGSARATGQAPNTAGPHKSDMMNKVDPRVDSDLDGSKTMGGDKTFSQSNTYAAKDPTDAAQVPPSVLQKHIGPPTLAHDDHEHDRAQRHSVSHQTEHRGL